MTDQPVLVLTCLQDTTSDVVIEELNIRGVPVVRCDPGDLLAGDLHLSARYHHSGPTGHLQTPTRDLDLSRVRSVYYRRPSPYVSPTWMSPQDGLFSVEQARYGLGGALASLRCRWVNHIWGSVGAEYKPVQLATAIDCGFAIPPTLVTNEVDQAHSFAREHPEGIVYKPLHLTELRDHTGKLEVIWVRPVDPDGLDERVGLTAHLFQATVDKVADVRTTVIGDRMFSIRIDSPHLDWRQDYTDVTYTVIDTPERIAAGCRAYLDRFGLLFGAFDFGITRDAAWVFYECNTAGQWHWLEVETGLPMTTALADLLENTS